MDKKILWSEIVFQAVRSRGPGGQNVNKVSSAIQIFWNPATTLALPEATIQRILNHPMAPDRNSEGFWGIRSDEYRDQPRNKDRAVEKLIQLILELSHIPKKRRPIKATFSSKQKRLKGKKVMSEKKSLRQRIQKY